MRDGQTIADAYILWFACGILAIAGLLSILELAKDYV